MTHEERIISREQQKGKRMLQQYLVQVVQKERLVATELAIRLIAEENRQLLNATTTTFIYKGVWYPRYNSEAKVNRDLHPSLRKRVSDLVDIEDFETTQETAALTNYFGILVNQAGHVDDLYAILPQQMHSYIAPWTKKTSAFTKDQPMNQQQIDRFRQENRQHVDYLNQLFLMKLLLGP